MVQKTIDLYSNISNNSAFNMDALFVEISSQHIACFVVSEKDNKTTAFEFYKIEDEQNDWQEIFYDVRKSSLLLDKNFGTINICYNFPEVVLVPAFKFYAGTVANFIHLNFGEIEKHVIKYDEVKVNEESIYVAYRINNLLHETIHNNFLAVNEFHSYSRLVKFHLGNDEPKPNALHIYFYNKSFTIIVVKMAQLQLIQNFGYISSDDAFYHLVNTSNKLELNPLSDLVTLAGNINENDKLVSKIKSHFAHTFFANVDFAELGKDKTTEHSKHFFTPFFNLNV